MLAQLLTLFHSNGFEPAIYAIFVACVLPWGFSIAAKLLGKFTLADHAHPRAFLANTTGAAARANAAQQNSFEILPFFIASVLLATYMVVPQPSINQLAWTFIFIRIAYGLAYILNKPILRSILWLLSAACPALLLKLCLQI